MTVPLRSGDPITVNVALGDRAYDIAIGRGLLATLGERINKLRPGCKVAIVTGGASGIGAASAETLAREGAKVVVTDIDEAGGNAVVGRITGAGGEAVFLQQDVTDETRWQEVVAETERRYGRLDILFSNAGIGIICSVFDMSLADFRRQTAINLDGVFLSVKHCLPLMGRTSGGSIILMSSLAGLRGAQTLAGYCATKGGVRLFAKAIAMECASSASVLRLCPVSSSRARADSFAGTSTTCSPSANSRCANGRPAPLLPSTAHIRSRYPATCLRIAAYPALSVVNRPVARTVSLSSTTSMVADSLWGSTPMMTCPMFFPT